VCWSTTCRQESADYAIRRPAQSQADTQGGVSQSYLEQSIRHNVCFTRAFYIYVHLVKLTTSNKI